VYDFPVNRIPAAVVCAAFAAISLGAELAVAQDSTCAFDTAAHSRIDSVVLGLAPGSRRDRHVPPDFLDAARAIQAYFRPPAHLRIPLWARTVGRSDLSRLSEGSGYVGYGLSGDVTFRLDDTGRLTGDSIEVHSASGDIIDAVVAAVKRADSANVFTPPSKDVRHDHGKIRLRFVRTARDATTSVPLLLAVITGIVLDSGPAMISFPLLQYPTDARLLGVEDRVLIAGVIRPDGRMEPSTVDLVHATYQEFAVEALGKILDARFRPASVAHCAVPVLVVLPIDFKMRRH